MQSSTIPDQFKRQGAQGVIRTGKYPLIGVNTFSHVHHHFYLSGMGPVSRESQELFGPEKPVVKL